MYVPADAPNAATGAMAEEEEEVEDDGKTVALAKGGVPTSRGQLEGPASRGRLEGSASRGLPTRQRGPPSSAATAKEE